MMIDRLMHLDGTVLLWIQEQVRGPVLTAFFSFYTRLGNAGLLWIVLSLLLLCSPKTRKAGGCALLAMLFGLLCTNVVLKHLVQRIRPWHLVEGLVHLVEEKDPNSFPSGHTTAAFAAGTVWLRTLPWRGGRIAALAMAVLMAFSRLYVGVHYPTDVLTGVLIGTGCALAALRLWDWAEREHGGRLRRKKRP